MAQKELKTAPQSEQKSNGKAPSLSELLDENCAYLMSCGLPCSDFWNGDYTYFRHYARAQEYRLVQDNQGWYLLASYIHDGFRAVIDQFSYGLSGRKGSKPKPFLDAPLPLTDIERKAELERKKQRTIAWFKKGQKDA